MQKAAAAHYSIIRLLLPTTHKINMITIISPSKTQDFSTNGVPELHSQPELLEQSELLVKELQKQSAADIAKLMEVSDKIAGLNYERFQSFHTPFSPENAKQALYAFKGDVYTGIDLQHYGKKEATFAQDHLRILSGLYGLLRPLDLIQPYRLEMKIKLKNKRGKDLYTFWDKRITDSLNSALAAQKNPALVNLASNEYFKAIHKKELQATVYTPAFKEFKNGKYSTIAIFAKKARGLMTDFIIKNKIDQPEKLKTFQLEGYEYSDSLSKGNEWVFVR
ncbi:peroxide stress protein YaaA [Nafulsella turpanensis]|uniref:peroxide stress protein YaaA n=1 Tax=Nafulsella turpanensis TaxID=1265690 RepID=UPI0003794AAB|nr:peroxide stress protein YaaA [Nafulsella turpanensis]